MKAFIYRSMMSVVGALVVASCASEPSYVQRVPAPAGAYYIKTVGGVARRVPAPPTTVKTEELVARSGTTPAVPRGEPRMTEKKKKRFSFFNWGRKRTEAPPPRIEDQGWWKGDTASGKPSMTINLGDQKVYYYKGGNLVGMAPISSGREGHDTVVGSFKVIEKDVDHRSSLYGDYVGSDGLPVKKEVDVRKDPKPPGAKFDGAEMNYFMRITGAIGMHEGYLPGYPASHGCIRMPRRMAKIFYEATPMGTPVKIVQ